MSWSACNIFVGHFSVELYFEIETPPLIMSHCMSLNCYMYTLQSLVHHTIILLLIVKHKYFASTRN